MKSIALIFACIIASAAMAAEPQTFEVAVIQVSNQAGQTTLESLKLSATDGRAATANLLQQHQYIHACTATTQEKANFNTGISASIRPVSVDSSGNILVDVDVKYSLLESMGSFKSNACQVQLPALKEFRTDARYQVGTKSPVQLGELRIPGNAGLRYEVWLFAKN